MVEYSPDLDLVYGALSSAPRRELVSRLAAAPSRVTDLAADFAMTFAGVSKHIQVLEHAGLVDRTIRGREHELRLQPLLNLSPKARFRVPLQRTFRLAFAQAPSGV